MDWLPIISTVGGFFLGGMSIYLNYKARTSPYREVLYSKQLDAYIEILDALIDFYMVANDFFIAKRSKESKKSVSQIKKQAMEKLLDVTLKHKRWLLIIPQKISNLLLKFVTELPRILGLPYEKDIEKKFRDAFGEILTEIYNSTGTEPLSKETLKLIMKIPS